jgi:hypothetical protein
MVSKAILAVRKDTPKAWSYARESALLSCNSTDGMGVHSIRFWEAEFKSPLLCWLLLYARRA